MNEIVGLASAVDAFDAVAHDLSHCSAGGLVLEGVRYKRTDSHAVREGQSLDAFQPIFNRCRHFAVLRERLDNVTMTEGPAESICRAGGRA